MYEAKGTLAPWTTLKVDSRNVTNNLIFATKPSVTGHKGCGFWPSATSQGLTHIGEVERSCRPYFPQNNPLSMVSGSKRAGLRAGPKWVLWFCSSRHRPADLSLLVRRNLTLAHPASTMGLKPEVLIQHYQRLAGPRGPPVGPPAITCPQTSAVFYPRLENVGSRRQR